jgi:large subunit ribosomal protein L29
VKHVDVKGKTDADLNKMVQDLENELFVLRVKKVTGQLEKTSNLRLLRKDLARAKTALRQRELAQVKG